MRIVTAVDGQLPSREERTEKRRVALASVAACLVLLVMKAAVGLASHSLGVLSEAASSGLDLIATLLTYVSVRISDKPADADHPYGHGKVESFSAFVETGLLLGACAWIVWEAVRRLMGRGPQVEPSLVAFVVLLLSMGIDLVRVRALKRVARKYQSQALEADAVHFSVDLWTTMVVLLGLGAVWVGERLEVRWLKHADPVAALVVASTILVLLFRLGKRSVDVLIDTAPAGLTAQVEAAVNAVEGVLSVERVRTRRSGNRTFIDLTIGVPRTLPFERVHAIADEVEEAVRSRMPRPDVVVHAEPRAQADETLFDHVRAIAQRNDLLVHELSAHHVREGDADRGRLILDLDAEVDERLTLREAHALVDQVEREIHRQIPQVAKINTHLETLGREVVPAASLQDLAQALEVHLRDVRRHFPQVLDCHDVQVRRVEGKTMASCHATLDGSLPITQVHDITQELEAYTRRRFPGIFRLTIHTEPPEDR